MIVVRQLILMRNADNIDSIVLLSAGLDSTANLALLVEQGGSPLAMTIDYGQRAAKREIENSKKIADFYRVPHQVVTTQWLSEIGESALTHSAQAMPSLDSSELDQLEVTRASARSVWVPNRNGLFIHIAAAYAEGLNVSEVWLGFNREEAVTFPDNSKNYMEAVSAALEFSTSNSVRVRSHTVDWDKREIVLKVKGLKRPFPFEYIWSCYLGEVRPCGKCESCRRLDRAIHP